MNEWAFAAEVKSWWDAQFRVHPEWGIARCEVEEKVEGDRTRSDLTLKGPSNEVLAAGELRLPDHPHSNPYAPDNLLGAINKAMGHGARWAFTSDGCQFLLIDTARPGCPWPDLSPRFWPPEVLTPQSGCSVLAQRRSASFLTRFLHSE